MLDSLGNRRDTVHNKVEGKGWQLSKGAGIWVIQGQDCFWKQLKIKMKKRGMIKQLMACRRRENRRANSSRDYTRS
jgi:hypothetical protein